MNSVVVRRALLSVSQKIGLVTFAQAVRELGIELISTGGTRKALTEAGLPVRDISDVTGFPEILDGRVKTLHPSVHGAILARRDVPQHLATLKEHGIAPIDLVVCNLYPFEATVSRSGATLEEIIENIDIGGPTLVRAAAKNFHSVAIVTDSEQYARVIEELKANQGALSLGTRERLATEAWALIAAYDRAIADYFTQRSEPEGFPSILRLRFERRMGLRYGENPHQQAAFYLETGLRHPAVASAQQLHGKELSFNNILDLDSALNLVREFDQPAAVVIKHNNPCGAATAATLAEAFQRAHDGDPLSAFGGVLGFNREVDAATAERIAEPNRFVEAIIAPGFSKEAMAILTTKPKWKENVRLLRVGDLAAAQTGVGTTPQTTGRGLDYRRVDGGLLVQSRDASADDFRAAKVVTKRQPTEREWADLQFAWRVAKHVKSNAIVYVKDAMVVGVGAGQMSRVDSVHLAGRKAGERARGAVMASDAFFPFRDNIDEAARAGIKAVVQPGGSVRDKDSVQACDELGLAMVFTGVRHFRH
jgi:phosphoribosylaminoimidazolecarboxamide formyltransferase/IMP cyclohydrolase